MADLAKEYDVIVVGGGINGIAAATYLQKSGMKVAVFERRQECGTQCCSEELMHPEVKVNLCANMLYLLNSPVYDELELERFGLEMIPSGPWAYFYPTRKDKSAVLMHGYDARETYKAWQSLNAHDAEVFRKLTSYFASRYAGWMENALFRPLTPEAAMGTARDLMGCPDLPADVLKMSSSELIEELFEDDRIKANLYAWSLLVDAEPLAPGTAVTALMMSPFVQHMWYQAGVARGGPHAITHALCRSFVHYGGHIFTNCPVAKIIVEGGEAKGVVLSEYAVYPEAEIRAAKAVCSDLSPTPTFEHLIGLDYLAPEHAAALRAYRYDAVILFTTYFALNEPLDWSGAGFPKEIDRAHAFNFGVDDGVADIRRAHPDWVARRPPDPPIVCGASVQGYCFVDPTQAPRGQYSLMTWANVPADLDLPGGILAWDDIREEYGDKVEDLLASYVPNLKKAKVGRYCESPLGYARRNPSQIMGHWMSAKIPSQTGLNAPFPGCGAPRSPIAKLYLAHYTGPNTAMDGGYKAADAIAQDVGLREQQDWWSVKVQEPLFKWFKRRGIEPHWTVD